MKFTLLIIVVSFAISNALRQELIDNFVTKMQEVAGVCSEELNASPDDIAELIAHKFPPSTHSAKCLIFCIQKKFNMMNEDGTLNQTGALEALNPIKEADTEMYEMVLQIFITCGMKAVIDKDPCETASGLVECGHKEAKKMALNSGVL